MNNLININGIVDINYPKQGLMDISNGGFENTFIDFGTFLDSDIIKELKKKPLDEIGVKRAFVEKILVFQKEQKNKNLICRTVKAPTIQNKEDNIKLVEVNYLLAKESISICKEMDCKYIIISPLSIDDTKEKIWEINRDFYISLALFAKENNVQILLENKTKDLHGHLVRGICADPYEAVEWIERLNNALGEKRFGFSMDMGICNIFGQDMYNFIKILGENIKVVIIRDNDGRTNDSLMPFSAIGNGTPKTEWLNLIRGLRETFFDGELVLDINGTVKAYSPLIYLQLLQTAKAIIDYFKWQIEIEKLLSKHKQIVLFGAGNMCRNYLKCYGEKYPPLFTCDNNEARWGENFYGLEIKSPEKLKEISDDCAIFICNIYYREISEQLREMGIKNTIEFFNDEYLPAYHFDRILV